MMGRMTIHVIAAAVLAAVAGGAIADTIVLTDGTRIIGTLGRDGNQMVITRTADGKKIPVAPSDVKEVTLTSSLTPAEKAENAWKQVQRDTQKLNKLEDVIAAFEKFANDNRSAAGEKAHNAAVSYRQLLTQDPVKFRGRWVARAQIDVLLRQEQDQAKELVSMYRAGRVKDTLEQARATLKQSPQNPLVLTIAGLSAYRLNQLPLAKEFFTKLVEVNETSVLGQNNLAVVAFQMKSPVDGLGYYSKALQAGPENRMLLDNIVEGLAAAETFRQSQPYVALSRQFAQADATMQAKFAKEGLFRYGSTWVTQAQRDRLVQGKIALKAAADSADSAYANAQRTLEGIGARIAQAKSELDAATAEYNTWAVQSNATYDGYAMTRRDLAAQDVERARKRLSQLEEQRAATADSIAKFKEDAASTRTTWSVFEKDQVTGVQRIMDLGDEEVVPAPTAIALPPEIEKPAEDKRPVVQPNVEQIPQQSQTVVVERQVPVNNYPNNYGNGYGVGGYGVGYNMGGIGFGSSTTYGYNYPYVVSQPIYIIGGGGPPTIIQGGSVIRPGTGGNGGLIMNHGGVNTGNVAPRGPTGGFPAGGAVGGIPMFTPAR